VLRGENRKIPDKIGLSEFRPGNPGGVEERVEERALLSPQSVAKRL